MFVRIFGKIDVGGKIGVGEKIEIGIGFPMGWSRIPPSANTIEGKGLLHCPTRESCYYHCYYVYCRLVLAGSE